jgi:hypothetical protein
MILPVLLLVGTASHTRFTVNRAAALRDGIVTGVGIFEEIQDKKRDGIGKAGDRAEGQNFGTKGDEIFNISSGRKVESQHRLIRARTRRSD